MSATARDAQWQARAALVGFALATDITTNEALLAGVAVPRSKLNQDALRRIGEPAIGPDFTIDPERVDELALRLDVTRNGDGTDHEPVFALTIQTLDEFAAIDEESARPILGGEDSTLLSHGGMLVFYGDGGAGKTTIELDLIMHLASGTDWMGYTTHGQSRILVIENEGPRGMFRKKVRRKRDDWQGATANDHIFILEDPWAVFSFADQNYRDHLQAAIVEHDIDIVAAGPVNRLGIAGGGTPEEVGAFILNIELIRQTLERPLAVVFAHHENKAGDVSGAWEGVPDTLAHVQAQGHGKTRLHWQKVRWGPELHGKTWSLLWRDGETFELEEAEQVTDVQIEASILDYVADNPSTSWNAVNENVAGNATKKRTIRDALLKGGQIVNEGNGKSYKLRCVPASHGLDAEVAVSQTEIALDDADADIPF